MKIFGFKRSRFASKLARWVDVRPLLCKVERTLNAGPCRSWPAGRCVEGRAAPYPPGPPTHTECINDTTRTFWSPGGDNQYQKVFFLETVAWKTVSFPSRLKENLVFLDFPQLFATENYELLIKQPSFCKISTSIHSYYSQVSNYVLIITCLKNFQTITDIKNA